MKIQLQDMLKNFVSVNRRLHMHLGLFLLLFIWLFFISGLIIHHGEWKFAKFYENRKESKKEFIIATGLLHEDPYMGYRVKEQLKIEGEVSNLQVKEGIIDFRVDSPGLVQEIHIDSQTGLGVMKVMKYNFWGKLRTLHTFNGLDKNNPSKTPNWIAAKLWRLMMDITAVILIVLCLGSWVMFYKVRKDYKWGFVLLGLGLIISGYYMFVIDLL